MDDWNPMLHVVFCLDFRTSAVSSCSGTRRPKSGCRHWFCCPKWVRAHSGCENYSNHSKKLWLSPVQTCKIIFCRESFTFSSPHTSLSRRKGLPPPQMEELTFLSVTLVFLKVSLRRIAWELKMPERTAPQQATEFAKFIPSVCSFID